MSRVFWNRLIDFLFQHSACDCQVTSQYCPMWLYLAPPQAHSGCMLVVQDHQQLCSINQTPKMKSLKGRQGADGWFRRCCFLIASRRDRKIQKLVCAICVCLCVCFGGKAAEGEGRKWGFAVPDWLASVALAALAQACKAICDWVPANAPRLPVTARQSSVSWSVRVNKNTDAHTLTYRRPNPALTGVIHHDGCIALNDSKPVNRWRRWPEDS